MSTGLTPEQRTAAEATLRQWRRHQPGQVPCHYCGTLVWIQYAEPVPDNPADPYDRYACTACGAEGRGHRRIPERSTRRHRARQVRARIVALAQEYRIACDRLDAEGMAVEQGEGDLASMEDAGKAMDAARAALFRALEELDMLEGEGR